MCELCENDSVKYDSDLTMWLCVVCYGEYNNIPAEIELDEVY